METIIKTKCVIHKIYYEYKFELAGGLKCPECIKANGVHVKPLKKKAVISKKGIIYRLVG